MAILTLFGRHSGIGARFFPFLVHTTIIFQLLADAGEINHLTISYTVCPGDTIGEVLLLYFEDLHTCGQYMHSIAVKVGPPKREWELPKIPG